MKARFSVKAKWKAMRSIEDRTALLFAIQRSFKAEDQVLDMVTYELLRQPVLHRRRLS